MFGLTASAQTISYFNQGFLRQGTAQLDRDYLGIFGSNIFYWGTNAPWASNNYVLRSGDIMSGVLSNQSDLIVIRGTNDTATLQLEVPNIYAPPTFTGVTLQFSTNSVFYLSSLSNQFNGDTYGKSWWGDAFGLTNIQVENIASKGLIHTNGNDYAVTFSNRVAIYTNRSMAFYIGTNPPAVPLTHSNIFRVDSSASINSLSVHTNGAVLVGGVISTAGSSPSSGTTPNGIYPNQTSKMMVGLSGNYFNFAVPYGSGSAGSVVMSSLLHLGWSAGGDASSNPDTWFSRMSAGNILSSNNLTVAGSLIPTNGVIQMVYATNGVTVCTTNRQTYLLSGTNELVTLVNAANVPNVIYRFSSTNQNGSFIVTNATGTQTIRDGTSKSYTNIGVGEIGFISDGAHWWLASKGKTIFPNASWSTSTNTTFPNITNTITLQTTDHGGDSQGIGLDNSAWFTFGVGSRIWITNSGDYMLTFSAVWSKGPGTPSNGDIWLRKNGTDVPNTATIMTIQSGATNVMTVNLFLNVTTPSYFDLQGASTDGNGILQALPAITSPFNRPAMPSIIVTVNKISD